MGAWLARHSADPVEDDRPALVGPTVGGRTVRGSRQGDQSAIHLLAAVLHPPSHRRRTGSIRAATSSPPTRCTPGPATPIRSPLAAPTT
ncbi:hypothetical protein NGM37_60475, partial [Streptomyces sp. TRM76130]|nr:hypothetical protein [Streptomyces sp. TRM76130]